MKKIFYFTLLSLFLPVCSLHAQIGHWQFDPHDFQYDMTAYVTIKQTGVVLTDLSNYEIAAFCGDEYRGVAELMAAGASQIGYLRIRSNSASGESITFKVYDKAEQKEIEIIRNSVSFTNNGVVGMPSDPYVLEIPQPYMIGDVNGDGSITAQDASLVQQLVAKKVTAATEGIVYEAADVNGDGAVTAQDASLIQQHVAKKIDLSTINQ